MARQDPSFESINEAEADAAVEAQSGLIRNSATMAGGSILSRVTGILRDMSLAAALGMAISRDAFTIGVSLPNIVYVLVIGGALNAVFVPQLVRRMRDDADAGRAYTDSLLSLTGVLLLAVTVVAVLAAPWIVRVYATSSYSADEMAMAIAFARYCLPQVLFLGIYTMLAQVLNARGSFGPPMFAPILSNLVAIAAYVSFLALAGTTPANGVLTSTQTAWLGLGTTLGIAAQALILIPYVTRSGYRWRFSRRWRGMGMRKSAKLAGWTMGLVAATQVAFLVVSRLATQANVDAASTGGAPAGLATYTQGFLVFMIPHGIITVSIVTAQLPNLSRTVHAGLLKAAGLEIGHTMRLAAVVITPVALVLMFAAQPLSAVLFRYGATQAAAANELGVVIAAFMLGLLPFTLYYVLQRGWYAAEDTRTPFLLALFTNGVFIVAAVSLFRAAGSGGPQVTMLAVAYSASNWLTFLVAWPMLRRSYGSLDSRRTFAVLARITVAAVVAIALNVLVHLTVFPFYEVQDSKWRALLDLVITGSVISAGYGICSWLLRVAEIRELSRWVRARMA